MTSYQVLFTSQITQKRKTWADGVLRQKGRKYTLYNEDNKPINTCWLKESDVAVGKTCKTDKHLINILDILETNTPSNEDNKPQTSITTAPIRRPKLSRNSKSLGIRTIRKVPIQKTSSDNIEDTTNNSRNLNNYNSPNISHNNTNSRRNNYSLNNSIQRLPPPPIEGRSLQDIIIHIEEN